jgi:hypothetical protein
MLDEVQQSNPGNTLEDCCDPENIHSFSQGSSAGGALVEFNNKYNQKS